MYQACVSYLIFALIKTNSKDSQGIEIKAVVGPPSGFTTYVGFAPCDDE